MSACLTILIDYGPRIALNHWYHDGNQDSFNVSWGILIAFDDARACYFAIGYPSSHHHSAPHESVDLLGTRISVIYAIISLDVHTTCMTDH